MSLLPCLAMLWIRCRDPDSKSPIWNAIMTLVFCGTAMILVRLNWLVRWVDSVLVEGVLSSASQLHHFDDLEHTASRNVRLKDKAAATHGFSLVAFVAGFFYHVSLSDTTSCWICVCCSLWLSLMGRSLNYVSNLEVVITFFVVPHNIALSCWGVVTMSALWPLVVIVPTVHVLLLDSPGAHLARSLWCIGAFYQVSLYDAFVCSCLNLSPLNIPRSIPLRWKTLSSGQLHWLQAQSVSSSEHSSF